MTVHQQTLLDTDNSLTILVVYHNLIPDVRATRRALRARHHVDLTSGRHRRGVRSRVGEQDDGYCRRHTWLVDFRVLNWTWVVAPHQFEAGYCDGRCPSHRGDLNRVNLTNHAFLRMVHRAWAVNVDNGQLAAPSCVSVQYMPLSMLYKTDENTFELRHISEMISTACGCL